MGLRPLPSIGGGSTRMKGFDVITMKSRKASPIEPWMASTRARNPSGRLPPNTAKLAVPPGSDCLIAAKTRLTHRSNSSRNS